MSRLWKASMAFGLAGAVAMTDTLRFGRSMWPAVALFVLAGLLACVAACIESATESAKHEAELDKASEGEAIKREATRAAVEYVATSLETIDRRLDHLEKKDALNALG